MNTVHLEVWGMSCGGCVKSVTAVLTPMSGVTAVDVNLSAGRVIVTGDLPEGGDPLALALTAAGYPAKIAPPTTLPTVAQTSGGCCG